MDKSDNSMGLIIAEKGKYIQIRPDFIEIGYEFDGHETTSMHVKIDANVLIEIIKTCRTMLIKLTKE
jgi:hypothetical protein